MTDEAPPEIDMPHLVPGTPVRHPGTGEEGMVVHCCMSREIQGWNCRVALFKGERPDWRSDERPQILRYASTSLIVLENGV